MKKIAYSLSILSIAIIYSTYIIYRATGDSTLGSLAMGAVGYTLGIISGIMIWIIVTLLRRYVFIRKKHFIIDFIFNMLLIFVVHVIVNVITYLITQTPQYYSWDKLLLYHFSITPESFNF